MGDPRSEWEIQPAFTMTDMSPPPSPTQETSHLPQFTLKKHRTAFIDSRCSSKPAFVFWERIWSVSYINAECWKIQEDVNGWKTSPLETPECLFSEMLCFYLYEEKVNCGGRAQNITTQAKLSFNKALALHHSFPSLLNIFLSRSEGRHAYIMLLGLPWDVCVCMCAAQQWEVNLSISAPMILTWGLL